MTQTYATIMSTDSRRSQFVLFVLVLLAYGGSVGI